MNIKVFLPVVFVSLLMLLLGGCSLESLWGINPAEDVRSSGDNPGYYSVRRLTDNLYQDRFPKIAVDDTGEVAVLWLSLERRTPVIKGRFFSSARDWSEEKKLGSCVGSWDIAPSPRGGFLLARSHWGNLYVHELAEGGKEHLISSGTISSPSILAMGNRAYIIWQRKLSEEVNAIEGAILREGNWTNPIQILTMEKRISRSFLLDGNDRLLLVFILERDGGSSIYLTELSGELRLVNPLRKLRDLGVNYPNLKGGTASDGSFWLAWDGGIRGGEQIYVSSSSDGKIWSEPERISLLGERNIDPAVAVDQHVIYVVWTSFSQREGEGAQYGRIRGRWHQVGAEGWQEIEGLYQEGISVLGRDAAITAGRQDQVWLAWEWEDEIYVSNSVTEELASWASQTQLALKDYANLFRENTLVVIGVNATEIERQSMQALAQQLKELTGNAPVVKKDTEILESDKMGYNLIIIGTPDSNSILMEVYELIDATELANEYQGILEILRNPWNPNKALLIVAGSDELGVKAASLVLTDSEKVGELNGKMVGFERIEIGDKIVYYYQRMIDGAIVEKDYIVYQFDKETKELLAKKIHWRSGLPEHLPPIISIEKAESMVRGEVQFSRLYFISPESDVFPLAPPPENPCWVVRSTDNGEVIITIIDAVEGKILGYGVPPPTG